MAHLSDVLGETRPNIVLADRPKTTAGNRWRVGGESLPSDVTPRSKRRGGAAAVTTPDAATGEGTPQSGARLSSGMRPSSSSGAFAQGRMTAFLTPQKSLFQRYLLPEMRTKPALTVVLDLDETLVSNRRADLPQAILRPYVLHVLHALRMMEGLELVMWTASTRETGAAVAAQLQVAGRVFDHIIYRNEMWFTEPIHTKDMRLLGREPDRVVIFDNAPNCCKLNPECAVLVEDFTGVRHESDAALVNVYYMIEDLLKGAHAGFGVRSGLQKLLDEGHLCRPIHYELPEGWQRTNLRDVPPLRVPPHGKYIRAQTLPPNAQTMKHWTI